MAEYEKLIGDCPDSPNCVSTLTDQSDKKMPAIEFSPGTDVLSVVKKVVSEQPRTEIVEQKDSFLHVVFKSFIFRFKDDVYFYVDSESNLLHFKSQSRTGYSDLGKNRSRMEELTSLIKAELN